MVAYLIYLQYGELIEQMQIWTFSIAKFEILDSK